MVVRKSIGCLSHYDVNRLYIICQQAYVVFAHKMWTYSVQTLHKSYLSCGLRSSWPGKPRPSWNRTERCLYIYNIYNISCTYDSAAVCVAYKSRFEYLTCASNMTAAAGCIPPGKRRNRKKKRIDSHALCHTICRYAVVYVYITRPRV